MNSKLPKNNTFRSFSIPWVIVICMFLGNSLSEAQFEENFEASTPSWRKRSSNCSILSTSWKQSRKSDPDVQNQNLFESLTFQNGHGTEVLVSHPMTPAFVITELAPSVRVRSPKRGVRIMARVVLPHTAAPNGIGPMTTLIAGETYENQGRWQTIRLKEPNSDLRQKLQKEIWILRQKYGSQVSEKNAYIDQIVLNTYTGPGNSLIDIDDLKVTGIVEATKYSEQVAMNGVVTPDLSPHSGATISDPQIRLASNTTSSNQKSLVIRDGTILLVRGKPFLPRIIQHNGEPFNYLKSLGFNTIELTETATPDQLERAQELEIWLICPAPKSAGLRPIEFNFDPVLCWSVGEDLTARNLKLVQQQVREIRESDQRKGRPILGNVDANWSAYSRPLDIQGIGIEPMGTSFFASQYSDWIRQRLNTTGNSKPIWVDLQTELSPALTKQIKSLAQKVPPVPVQPAQLQFLLFEAIAGGARGLRYVSHHRLDAPDPETRLRAQTLEWLNITVDQLEPWIIGGVWMGEIETEDPQLEIHAINTTHSRLLLVQRPTHHEQYLAGDQPFKDISFDDSNASMASQAYRLTETGLTPLPATRTHAGARIQLPACSATTAVVMTESPLVINRLRQSYERTGQRSLVQLKRDLMKQWLAITQLVTHQIQRMEKDVETTKVVLGKAMRSFQQAQQFLDSSNPQAAVEHLRTAELNVALAQRTLINQPISSFQSKMSSPFVAHLSLIPMHWDLSNRLVDQKWNPNGLAGGDFENLSQMKASGWTNRRINSESISTRVELSDSAKVDGQYGLKLVVAPNRSQAIDLIEATPLWISTPPISVRAGQLIRIHGWVKVPHVLLGSHQGLTITDNLGGPEMAERIHLAKDWQEFTLYRGVPESGTLQVTFSLHGIGEAYLDEVTIRSIDLPPTSIRAAKLEAAPK